MRRYSVRNRKPIVDFFVKALEDCGITIVRAPDYKSGPFELSVRGADGREVDLVCYAFLANNRKIENRPKDEHRFQIKYGSDFKTYHEIFIDRERARLTLMFGVHLDAELFVAVDPTMHNPTWFSKSFFFKDWHVEQVQDSGWFSWHRPRQRLGGRRKKPAPEPTLADEVLLGFTSQHFGDYMRFEHLATGMHPRERKTLAERFLGQPPQRAPEPLAPWQASRGKESVFISYSHADTAFVDRLEDRLDQQKIKCWRDVKSLAAGPIEDQIKLGMESNPVVLVLSRNSINSDFVQWEAAYARQRERTVGRHVLCPIALDDAWKQSTWPGVLKQQITGYNILDFSRWGDSEKFKETTSKLVSGLRDFYFPRKSDRSLSR